MTPIFVKVEFAQKMCNTGCIVADEFILLLGTTTIQAQLDSAYWINIYNTTKPQSK